MTEFWFQTNILFSLLISICRLFRLNCKVLIWLSQMAPTGKFLKTLLETHHDVFLHRHSLTLKYLGLFRKHLHIHFMGVPHLTTCILFSIVRAIFAYTHSSSTCIRWDSNLQPSSRNYCFLKNTLYFCFLSLPNYFGDGVSKEGIFSSRVRPEMEELTEIGPLLAGWDG